MAKPPCARLTKPIRPMVTDRPTDTMNSTMPAATPPSTMLAMSAPKITGGPAYVWRGANRDSVGRARPDLQLLARVLHPLDLADHLLVQLAIRAHHHLGQVFIHHDVAGDGIDHDRAARTVEAPLLDRGESLVGFDLALERLRHVHDQ